MHPVLQEDLSSGVLRRLFVPAVILIIGLALTAAAALMAQSSAIREQELLFDASVDTEIRNFETSLANHLDDFDDAVDFVAATFPASHEEFNLFFRSSSMFATTSTEDPGLALIEPVDVDAVGALEAREALLGQEDFRVTSFSGDNDTRYVVTRLVADSNVGIAGIYGADVRPFVSEQLLEQLIIESSFAIPIDEIGTIAEPFEPLSDDYGIRRVVLVERINDPSIGSNLGWLVRFFNVDDVLNTIAAQSDGDINAQLTTGEESALIVDVDPDTESLPDDTALSLDVVIEQGPIEWSLTLWADEGFGVQTGLFEQSTIWLLGMIATLVAFVGSIFWVVNRQLLDTASFELKHARTLASTDPLTGLLNRKGFVEAVDDQDLSGGGVVIFIDLDGFKEVNDTRGHAEGDRVLRSVADIIRTQFRNADIVSRFGGDEFMVFAPQQRSGLSGAEAADRVVAAIADADLGVTCSVGSAERPPFDLTPVETLIRKADRAMYRAKEAGGNRVERSARRPY